METPWWLYVVRCSDNSLYCGVTPHVEKRVQKHNAGQGAKYTKHRSPVSLVAAWKYQNRSLAQKQEYGFKQLTRADKLQFVNEFTVDELSESPNFLPLQDIENLPAALSRPSTHSPTKKRRSLGEK